MVYTGTIRCLATGRLPSTTVRPFTLGSLGRHTFGTAARYGNSTSRRRTTFERPVWLGVGITALTAYMTWSGLLWCEYWLPHLYQHYPEQEESGSEPVRRPTFQKNECQRQ